MPNGCHSGKQLREGLFEGALAHADWTQDLPFHHGVEGLASQILKENLRDGVASP